MIHGVSRILNLVSILAPFEVRSFCRQTFTKTETALSKPRSRMCSGLEYGVKEIKSWFGRCLDRKMFLVKDGISHNVEWHLSVYSTKQVKEGINLNPNNSCRLGSSVFSHGSCAPTMFFCLY